MAKVKASLRVCLVRSILGRMKKNKKKVKKKERKKMCRRGVWLGERGGGKSDRTQLFSLPSLSNHNLSKIVRK